MLLAALALFIATPPRPRAPRAVDVPLTPDAWTATDQVRALTYLGRPALYIDRGVALVKNAELADGTYELDMAASDTTSFLGISFRAVSPTFSNVIYVRPSSTDSDVVQYGPAFNTVGVAWQVYHGPGANAPAVIPRNRWVHVKLELAGPVARIWFDTATQATMVVPRVAASGGSGIGVWAGAFGRGAYFSNVRYTPAASATSETPGPALPAGTISDWQLSPFVGPASFDPAYLPDLAAFTWQAVTPEPEGFVLVNRYREAPVGGTPRDRATGQVLADSVMTGRMAGERVVYARTTITAARDEIRRLQFTYCNGIVIYLNGRPLALAMNPGGLRATLPKMVFAGDAVYLPLKRGRNELVVAVVNLTGGWAFGARLDPTR